MEAQVQADESQGLRLPLKRHFDHLHHVLKQLYISPPFSNLHAWARWQKQWRVWAHLKGQLLHELAHSGEEGTLQLFGSKDASRWKLAKQAKSRDAHEHFFFFRICRDSLLLLDPLMSYLKTRFQLWPFEPSNFRRYRAVTQDICRCSNAGAQHMLIQTEY